MREGYKTLGIIGGMGSKATSVFFDRLVDHTAASCDQEHINTVILNYADFPDRTASIRSGETEEIIAAFEKCGRQLDYLGVSNIAITCNTAHYFIDSVRKSTSANVISMIEESVRLARSEGARRIGIMATDGTVMADVYGKVCSAEGLTAVYPPAERQADVMSLIYEDIKQGRPGDPEKFNRVMKQFAEDDCDKVILACTELSVYKETNDVPDMCIDAMDVLVRVCIEKSGASYI